MPESDFHGNDRFIWQAFLKGKKWALTKIFNNSYDDLFNYGIKLYNNSEQVKDLIQDLFLKLWNNRKNLSSTNKIKPYLLRSLRTLIIDYIRANITRDILESNLLNNEILFEYSPDHFMDVNNHENEMKVLNHLNDIAPRQKEAIYLRYFKSFNYSEIAQIMNINVQSARNLVHEGIQIIRQKFNKEN